jgi:hypothetical protein
MEDSKTLFWSTKSPCFPHFPQFPCFPHFPQSPHPKKTYQTISSKFCDNLGTSPRNGMPALDYTNDTRMESRGRAGSTLRIREVPCSDLTPKTEYPEVLHGCIRYLHANSGTALSMCIFRLCQRCHICRDVYFFTVGLNVPLLVRVAHVPHRMSLSKGEIKANVSPNNGRLLKSILSTAKIKLKQPRFSDEATRCTLLLSIFISPSLHVSGNNVPIIRRTYCIYATPVFFTLYGWLSGL